jgi:hypothetical protein
MAALIQILLLVNRMDPGRPHQVVRLVVAHLPPNQIMFSRLGQALTDRPELLLARQATRAMLLPSFVNPASRGPLPRAVQLSTAEHLLPLVVMFLAQAERCMAQLFL